MSDNFTFISNGVLSTYSYNNQGAFNPVSNLVFTDTVNGNTVSINTTSISIANSTSNIHILNPNAVQSSSSNYWLNANGQWAQITSSVSTIDANNCSYLLTRTWVSPGAIGSTTANTGAFTTLTASTGNVTTLTASTGNVTTLSTNTISANSGSFANISVSSNLVTIGTAAYHVSNGNMGIGNSTPVDKLSVNGNTYINGVANIVGSLYAPIFYDSNNISYYVNPASNTNLYGLTVEQTINGSVSGNATNITGTYGGSLTSTQITNALGYTPYNSSNPSGFISSVTNISGTAAYATAAAGSSFYTTGTGGENQIGVALSGYNPVYLYNNTGYWGIYSASGSSIAYYNRSNGYWYFGNGNAYVDSSGYFHSSNLYAPIFYDSNDTGYYSDPASTSNFNILGLGTTGYVGRFQVYNGGTVAASFVGGWGNYGKVIQLRTDGAGGQDGPMLWFHKDGAKDWGIGIRPYSGDNGFWISEDSNNASWGTERFRMDPGGSSHFYVDLRAPIYYDENNTAYYIDPSSTADLGSSHRGGMRFGPNSSWGAYLYVGTNSRSGSSASVATSDGNLHLDSQDSHSMYLNWYSGQPVYVSAGIYPTIMYDRDNTGYYCDPNSSSNMNNVTVAGTATFADGTSQTSAGGFPNFNGNYADLSYSTWYQATANWYVQVIVRGPYMNDFYAYAGPSTTSYYTIGNWGDDINSNTKWSTFSFFVRKGTYFWVNSEVTSGPYRRWTIP